MTHTPLKASSSHAEHFAAATLCLYYPRGYETLRFDPSPEKGRTAMVPVRTRSRVAIAAILHPGSGKHLDRRTKRQRTRAAMKTAAIREQR